jgi:hypothetical protein
VSKFYRSTVAGDDVATVVYALDALGARAAAEAAIHFHLTDAKRTADRFALRGADGVCALFETTCAAAAGHARELAALVP